MAAANNFGSFMNALSFVTVVSRTWTWFQPRTQLEVFRRAARERKMELEEAQKLGVDVRVFIDRLKMYEERYRALYVETHSALGIVLLFDYRVKLMWDVRSLVVEVVRLKRDIVAAIHDAEPASLATARACV